MLKNILIYLLIFAAAFAFSVFYYAWFSWFLLIVIICIPLVSLAISLPFMIYAAVKGISCFCDETAENFGSVNIGIKTKNGKRLFCPFLKVKFKTSNSFAGKSKSALLKYGGVINKPVVIRSDTLAQHCGLVNIKANYGRVYDFTGIFFLPIRLKFSGSTVIMPIPEAPYLQPDSQSTVILGYKPKSGGGFSDYYELRPYQSGDSLKNIHWKLSSKYDDLIVKEPSEAIYKRLIIKPEITDNPEINDFILARFIYVCSCLIKNEAVFYAFNSRSGAAVKIENESDVRRFLVFLYSKSGAKQEICLDNAAVYNILPDSEEVSEL
ncbi:MULTISPECIES: DUF58 domain-containing protein [unclassified Ruminococcus]|uniref:DUF58 domain-containing protein n=1 Tax=unclassified Ruminococcus TaxID=2608920 RepID=UPI00210C9384|nr:MULTISPECIES: DUF58 domain-containing protein [unclassified Ruminococcus]MCQ4021812.1 DUF58 domain-containing protein [Ruminococcus sp. zg-924]MCQ4114257.1 DUF58 domain-containing protein [Ruminococcus sp. zg-921]